jgi:hypothetical protein
MSSLQVTFPDEWATLPVRDGGREKVHELVLSLAEAGAEAQQAAEAFFSALLPTLDRWGIAGFASLALPDEESGGLVQAFCAIAVVAAQTGADAELRTIAEDGPHPGLERDTRIVRLPTGAAARSAAFRFAEELLDDEGLAPYAGELRYAIALPGNRVGILHFETLSLVYFAELERLFDAIAGTAQVA